MRRDLQKLFIHASIAAIRSTLRNRPRHRAVRSTHRSYNFVRSHRDRGAICRLCHVSLTVTDMIVVLLRTCKMRQKHYHVYYLQQFLRKCIIDIIYSW